MGGIENAAMTLTKQLLVMNITIYAVLLEMVTPARKG